MNQEQRQRLLDVARACREAPEPSKFDMGLFTRCGTPACAAGHYAFRADLHGGRLSIYDGSVEIDGHRFFVWAPDYFGISDEEAEELFNDNGCTGLDEDEWSELDPDDRPAVTNTQAADYIEAFVARKEAEASR